MGNRTLHLDIQATGPVASGKSTVLDDVIRLLREEGYRVVWTNFSDSLDPSEHHIVATVELPMKAFPGEGSG